MLSPSLVLVLGFGILRANRANSELPQPWQSPLNQRSWVPSLAQASSQPLSQQGGQIVLNGRTVSANWSQRQQSIGIADAGLMQVLGVDLLNSGDPARQPVQWFSDPAATPLVLNTWLTPQFRYLDATELARQAGWQLQASQGILRIVTPPTRVLGVRQGRQTWGDRIVVDLDRATPWQVTEQATEFVVTLDARIDPTLAQNFVAGPGNRLTSIKVETVGDRTLIRVGVPAGLRPRVWTLPNPNRLVIDVNPNSLTPRNIAWVPGVQWQQQLIPLGSAQFPVYSISLNLRQSGVSLKPIWSDPSMAAGIAPLAATAQRWQAAAAINGGFFNRNNQLPLGAIRRDNRWVSGPILNRGAIAWNDAGEATVGRLSLQESVVTGAGQRLSVLALNSGYVQAGLARYTSDWGRTYTPLVNNEILITVQNGRVTQQTPASLAGQSSFPIPSEGYLLVARSYATAANQLPVNTAIALEQATSPSDFARFPHIMGAGPLLIQNRQIVLNAPSEQFSDAFVRQAALRSAIGVAADGTLMLVTVHNRIGGLGPTLPELAQLMQRLGAVNAVNLDGGSSTTLYLGGQLIDRAPATAARVHNGLGIFIQPGS